ncbi:hypothetical protein PROFUN_10908 [Planoprotostelium fungivorum]|uniref:Ion transport domain-containing protein n=1 Tax=Planoprotostelium fungivorum TaxID=1890364 RepID=A0A2P6NC57_9EUKA|nr:hypothetical protein PROFUN_10908 [Planoprotostelium fungivorum]
MRNHSRAINMSAENTPLLRRPNDDVSISIEAKPVANRYHRWKNLLYRLMEGGLKPWDTIIESFILLLIATNVILFILSTEESIDRTWGRAFDIFEIVSISIFTFEFTLRLWVCTERKRFKKKGPILGRVMFCLKPMSIIDLLSIIPFWVVTAFDFDLLHFSSAIRIFRVFRLFKAEKYTHALKILRLVVLQNREVLITTGFILVILFICTSTALYFAQRDTNHPRYGSIPATMYTSVLMLTAQGIPEDAEREITRNSIEILTKIAVTYAGKWVTAVTAVFSVAVFAVPAGLLGWGFESVGEKFIEQRKEKLKRKKAEKKAKILRGEAVESSSSSSEDFFSNDDSEEEKEEGEAKEEETRETNGDAIELCPHCKRAF